MTSFHYNHIKEAEYKTANIHLKANRHQKGTAAATNIYAYTTFLKGYSNLTANLLRSTFYRLENVEEMNQGF